MNSRKIKNFKYLYRGPQTQHYVTKFGVKSVLTLHKNTSQKKELLSKNCLNIPQIESTTIVKPSLKKQKGM
tara:strand:- start:930 stop:1142 length:213 start_codon:yes stop_codon:yes gene_type:complete